MSKSPQPVPHPNLLPEFPDSWNVRLPALRVIALFTFWSIHWFVISYDSEVSLLLPSTVRYRSARLPLCLEMMCPVAHTMESWAKVMVFLKFKLLAGQPLCVTPNWYTFTPLSFGITMMSKSPQLLPHPNAFALLPVILKVCEPLAIEPTQYTLASCHCVVLV